MLRNFQFSARNPTFHDRWVALLAITFLRSAPRVVIFRRRLLISVDLLLVSRIVDPKAVKKPSRPMASNRKHHESRSICALIFLIPEQGSNL